MFSAPFGKLYQFDDDGNSELVGVVRETPALPSGCATSTRPKSGASRKPICSEWSFEWSFINCFDLWFEQTWRRNEKQAQREIRESKS